jgi:hypothetical protein
VCDCPHTTSEVAVIAVSETPSNTVDTCDNDSKDMKHVDNDATANINDVKTRKKRKYLSSWQSKWSWLSYDPVLDVVKCQSCSQAADLKLLNSEKRTDDAFTSRGFKNWDKGPDRFARHEASANHLESITNLATITSVPSIQSTLSSQLADRQKMAREALTVIFTSLKFLASQNIAIRGARHDGGNFIELLKLRCDDKPCLKSWLSQRNNWMSDTIQNEILQMLAHDVQRQIVRDIEKSPYIGLIADGTTDVDGMEQFSISIQYLDVQSFAVHNAFVGMYNPNSSTADALTAAIVDVLLRLNIPMDKLRGHSFDGASNMSGRLNGVQAQLKRMQPKSVFVHCVNHSLDLALQETASDVPMIRDSLTLVKDCANVFRESAKRKQKLKQLAADIAVADGQNESVTLLALCPTRWCVRYRAITKLLKFWKVVLSALDELVLETGRGDVKCKMEGLRKQMTKMKGYFGVVVCQALFGPCEELATSLQAANTTATGAVRASNVLLVHLRKLRNEDEFNYLYGQAEIDAAELGLKVPQATDLAARRQVKPPGRYEMQNNTSEPHVFSEKAKLRSEYYTALDLLIAEVQRRFDQPSLAHMSALENALSNEEATEDVLDIYNDIDRNKLLLERKMLVNLFALSANSSQNSNDGRANDVHRPESVYEWAEYFAAQPSTVRQLFSETVKIIQLLLVVPATAAAAERTFSSLRRLKTWLRQTMTQKRLTHLALLHCHRQRLEKIDIDSLCEEFVMKTNERRSTFGLR